MCTGMACPQEVKNGVTDTSEKVETVTPIQAQGVGEGIYLLHVLLNP